MMNADVIVLVLLKAVIVNTNVLTNNVILAGLEENFNKSFITIWNAPSLTCFRKYGIDLDLSSFDIVANKGDTFEGDEIVIFYENRLGFYPWIDEDGNYINGGLPQLADYSVHIQKVVDDVNNFIPDVNFSGLAVIDWERWRPIFERNNYNEEQRVYIRESEAQVRKLHPDWSVKQVHSQAETEFQLAARRLMEGTLATCRQLRPRGHWGFYGFPACYNYHKGKSTCSNKTKSLNDRLDWLFNVSSVLLPSIYLSEKIGTHNARHARVNGELGEALRVAHAYSVHNTPLVAYSRFRYGDTGRFYDLADLNNTLRQSAEARLSGVALWDSSESFKTRTECEATKAYLDNQLGPYIRELSKDALECSRNVCSGHGRCVNTTFGMYYTNSHSKCFSKSQGYRVYEYLKNTALDLITSILEGFKTVLRLILNGELKEKNVSCVCFNGWKGENCSRNE